MVNDGASVRVNAAGWPSWPPGLKELKEEERKTGARSRVHIKALFAFRIFGLTARKAVRKAFQGRMAYAVPRTAVTSSSPPKNKSRS
jgi:hypothetical protein